MTTEPTPPIRRRWFQYRLRTLLVVMLVVSLGMGWVMKERRRIAERREALDAAGFRFFAEGLQPNWHLTLFGDDSPAFLVEIRGVNVADTGLVHLTTLTQLKWLYLGATQVTDAGLVHLTALTQLQSLYLGETQVTDGGLVYLQGLTQLHTLWLRNTNVTDAGVAKLQAALPNCTIDR